MKIGPYTILRQIAQGGMGEVLLVYDPATERSLAVKRIRENLKDKESIRKRFLREAKLTAGLTHPGIISIYQIHEEGSEIYYTMPYVEGKTLKQLLKKESSISSLLSIFRSICQTVLYAHSKGILHRDLKPENILVGNFGEVIILDWGLSEYVDDEEIEEKIPRELTMPGKIVGTLAFMSPERALGDPATVQSEIYALGVILYIILTLKLPFDRKSLKDFRENHEREIYIDPEEAAPYRDVPPRLSRIVKKCLSKKAEECYETVEDLLSDLSKHLEGRGEWFEEASLSLKNKEDWEFQENLLLTRSTPIRENDWVALSISKNAFGDPLRIQAQVSLGKECVGIGFLLNSPEKNNRTSPFDGYCLWLGAKRKSKSALFRNGIEVMQIPDLEIEVEENHQIQLEKSEKSIRLIINKEPRFTYLSYLPLTGHHIGILSLDADFRLDDLQIFTGLAKLEVSALAVPDAFLARKDYKNALLEYRRLALAFPGQVEGREALFRAGITLLEEAKQSKFKKRASVHFSDALEEFSKLHTTPSQPLEYLGKSLVYHAVGDTDEEIKCLELALRRYHKHPLILAIKEQILYRMHESFAKDRKCYLHLILMALRYIPEVFDQKEALYLFQHFIQHAERPYFIEGKKEQFEKKEKLPFLIELSYMTGQIYTLLETFEELIAIEEVDPAFFGNILFALTDLGAKNLAESLILQLEGKADSEIKEILRFLQPILLGAQEGALKRAIKAFLGEKPPLKTFRLFRTAIFLMEKAIFANEEKMVEAIASPLLQLSLKSEEKKLLDSFRIWAFLSQKKIREASILFENYSYEELLDEKSLLFFLYGIYLYLTENDEIFNAFYAGVSETPFPCSAALFAHEHFHAISKNTNWFNTAFFFEKRMLYREMILYSKCRGEEEAARRFAILEKELSSTLPTK